MEARMPEEFFGEVKSLLPPEKEACSKGGRPPVGHSIVMTVIWFVLVTGWHRSRSKSIRNHRSESSYPDCPSVG